MNFFSRQTFEVLDWPAKSPDLNPIETVWSLMEYDWPTMHQRNKETLHAVVQDRWNELGTKHGRHFFHKKSKTAVCHILLINLFVCTEYFRKLYRSMRKRCQQKIDGEGHTCNFSQKGSRAV